MNETLTITSERVDDIPLLLAQIERMGLQPLRDEYFPTHGNWVGLSLGGVTVIWLTHILAQADHQRNHVEPWAEKRLHPLRRSTGQGVHPWDLSDDRLAAVLEALRDDARWGTFAGALTQQRRRVDDRQPECVRVESTTASGDCTVTADGLFPFGHSQEHRPALPQVKGMWSALDPLGMSVATDVVPGQRADAPLYLPAMTRVQGSLGQHGLRDVGECQLGALETRAFIQAGGDDDRCPWSESQRPPEVWAGYLAPVWTGPQPWTRSARAAGHGQRAWSADGDEWLARLRLDVAGGASVWTERRLVVRSRQLARAGAAARRARRAKAQAAVAALNERGRGQQRFTALPALPAAVEASLTRCRVHGRLAVRDTERVHERPLRRDGRRPATIHRERPRRVAAVVDRRAAAGAVRRLGWRG